MSIWLRHLTLYKRHNSRNVPDEDARVVHVIESESTQDENEGTTYLSLGVPAHGMATSHSIEHSQPFSPERDIIMVGVDDTPATVPYGVMCSMEQQLKEAAASTKMWQEKYERLSQVRRKRAANYLRNASLHTGSQSGLNIDVHNISPVLLPVTVRVQHQ